VMRDFVTDLIGFGFVLAILIAGVFWILAGPPQQISTTLGTNTVNECRSWEDPSTTLCYRPSSPSTQP